MCDIAVLAPFAPESLLSAQPTPRAHQSMQDEEDWLSGVDWAAEEEAARARLGASQPVAGPEAPARPTTSAPHCAAATTTQSTAHSASTTGASSAASSASDATAAAAPPARPGWGSLQPPTSANVKGRRRSAGLAVQPAMSHLVVLDFEWTACDKRRMLPIPEITQFPSVLLRLGAPNLPGLINPRDHQPPRGAV